MFGLGKHSSACEESDQVDGEEELYDRYRFDVTDTEAVILITQGLSEISHSIKFNILFAVKHFINFDNDMIGTIQKGLFQTLCEFDRGVSVFDGSADGFPNDSVLSAFSPQHEDAFRIMKKRIRYIHKTIVEAYNLLYDILHHETFNSIEIASYWQTTMGDPFKTAIEDLQSLYDDFKFYTHCLRQDRLELVQPQAEYIVVDHVYDQDISPDEYEPYKKISTYDLPARYLQLRADLISG